MERQSCSLEKLNALSALSYLKTVNQIEKIMEKIKRQKVRNSANYKPDPKENEKFSGPSQTVPDEALSIRTMLEKHTHGIPMREHSVFNPEIEMTHDDHDFEELNRMDMVEKMEIIEENEKNKRRAKKRIIQLEETKKAAEKMKAEEDAAIREAAKNMLSVAKQNKEKV